MTTFLDKVVAETRERLARRADELDIAKLRDKAKAFRSGRESFRLHAALSVKDRVNIIAEIKRASPSRNDIDPTANAAERAKTYETSGAAAISILTEPTYFKGSLDDIRDARRAVDIPLLRKDFIVDEVQIYEAAIAGADAVLLIVAALSDAELRTLIAAADSLGLDALVETHDLDEVKISEDAVSKKKKINNRDLHTLAVDLATSFELAAHKPDTALFVAESGIRSSEEIEKLRNAGFDGFLIGEALMASPDPANKLAALAKAGGAYGQS